jgi:hypothetical protein
VLADGSKKQTQNKWTDEEEAVFTSLAEAQLKATMWQAVKEDGRLAHRGGNGIKAHIAAFVSL